MIRCAIWSAVSTEVRANNVSLDEQVARCRAACSSHTWVEVAGPYIVPGESRTRWVNLSDAERSLPALKAMLDDAQAGLFVVLVCYDYTRFRDLLDPIARTFSHYSVQLFSTSQPGEIIPPAEYSPYNDDSATLMRGMFQAVSRTEISAMRRRYRLGTGSPTDAGSHPARNTIPGLWW
jgi:DNA invertase Pin-like site-specific DNA recombinase